MSIYANMLGDLLSNKNVIPINVITIDFCGGYEEAVILTQLFYWMPRAQITSDNKRWIAKSYKDWEDEARCREKQSRRFIQLLVSLGFAETKIKRFNANPTTHIHLKLPEMCAELAGYHDFWRSKQTVINEHGETTTHKVYENMNNWRNVPAKTSGTERPKRTERNSQNVRNDTAKTDQTLTEPTPYPFSEPTAHMRGARKKNDTSSNPPKTHNAPAQTHGSVAPGAVTRATLTAFQTFCMEHDLAVIAAWPDVYRDADHAVRLAQFGHAQYLAELQAANGAKWKRKVKSGHRTLINWFKRIDAGTSLHNPAAVPDDRLLLAKKMATIYRAKYQETNNVPTKIKATDRDVLLELSDLIDETNPGADRLMAWGKWVDMLMLMTPTRKDAFDWRSKPLRGLLNNYGMITAQMMKTHAPMQAMSAAERESANVQNDILVQAARQAAADMEERRQEKERKAAAKRAARRAEIDANGGYDIYGRKVIFKD